MPKFAIFNTPLYSVLPVRVGPRRNMPFYYDYGRSSNRQKNANNQYGGRLFFQTGNSYISAVDWLSYNLYNVKCTNVSLMYQHSLGMMPNALNTDAILSVPNATSVPNVPKMTKNDSSVPKINLV